MGRPRLHTNALGPVVSVRLEGDVQAQLQAFADAHTGGSIAEALRMVLRDHFSNGSLGNLEEALGDTRHNAALRQVTHEARTAVTKALSKMWR